MIRIRRLKTIVVREIQADGHVLVSYRLVWR